MNKAKFKYKPFRDLKSFDIIPHEEVVRRYREVEDILEASEYGRNGVYRGTINSGEIKEDITSAEFKKQFKPRSYFVHELRIDSCNSKSDFTTMDMVGLGKTFDHWMYYTIPSSFVKTYQTLVLDNRKTELVNIFKEFMNICVEKFYTDAQIENLALEFDKLYPELYPLPTPRPIRPGWRFDLEVSLFHSLLRYGSIFPIAYNSTREILKRGTHRSLILGHTDTDTPILVQYPVLGGGPLTSPWTVYTTPSFSEEIYNITFDVERKKAVYRDSIGTRLMTHI